MEETMRPSVTLIDKARSLCSPPTYYRLAKQLKIGHQTLSRVRNRGGTLDNEAATRLAELLGQAPMDVIAIMEAERAKTPEKKAFWENRLPRVMPLVAYLGIISGVNHVTEVRAEGLTTTSQLIHYAYYAICAGCVPILNCGEPFRP
jgi:hypothetical protein